MCYNLDKKNKNIDMEVDIMLIDIAYTVLDKEFKKAIKNNYPQLVNDLKL